MTGHNSNLLEARKEKATERGKNGGTRAERRTYNINQKLRSVKSLVHFSAVPMQALTLPSATIVLPTTWWA